MSTPLTVGDLVWSHTRAIKTHNLETIAAKLRESLADARHVLPGSWIIAEIENILQDVETERDMVADSATDTCCERCGHIHRRQS